MSKFLPFGYFLVLKNVLSIDLVFVNILTLLWHICLAIGQIYIAANWIKLAILITYQHELQYFALFKPLFFFFDRIIHFFSIQDWAWGSLVDMFVA